MASFQEEQSKNKLFDQRGNSLEQMSKATEEANINMQAMESFLQAAKEGSLDTLDNIQQWSNSLLEAGVINQDANDILIDALTNLNNLGISSSEKYAIIKDIVDEIAGEVDLVSSLMKEVKQESTELANSTTDVGDKLTEMSGKAMEVGTQLKNNVSILEPFNDLQAQINEAFDRNALVLEDTQNIISNITDDSFDLASVEDARDLTLSHSLDLLTNQAQIQKDILSDLESKLKLLDSQLDSQELLNKLGQDEVSRLKEEIQMLSMSANLSKDILTTDQRRIQVIKSIGVAYKDATEQLSGLAGQMQSQMDSFIENIPGGSFIANRLGISKIGDAITDNLNGAFENFIDLAGQEGVSSFKALTQSAMTFGRGLLTALGPIGIIAGIATGLIMAMVTVSKLTKEISGNFGVSKDEAKNLLKTSNDITASLHNQVSTREDILGIMQKMVELDGSTVIADNETIARLATVGKHLGYGGEMAAELQDILGDLGADDKAATNMQVLAAKAAEASGFSSKLILQDVVDNAAELSEYFFGMPDQLLKAAIETRKLGFDIKKAANMADSLLDIESSLTAQFEASAALGRSINLDKARQLAYEGDLAGVAQEVQKAMGSRAEFEAMSVHQRRLLAKSVGMEVDDLVHMMDIQEKMGSLTADQVALAQKYGDKIANAGDLSQEQFETILGQLDATDKFSASWDKIKSQFMQALLPLIESFADTMGDLTPLIQPFISTLKGIGAIIKFISPLISGLMLPFKFIGATIQTINEMFDSTVETGTAFKGLLGDITGSFDGIGKVLLGGIGLLFGGSFLIKRSSKIFSFLTGGFKSLFSLVTNLFSVGKKGGLVSSILGGLDILNPFKAQTDKISTEAAKMGKDASKGLKKGLMGSLPTIKLPNILQNVITKTKTDDKASSVSKAVTNNATSTSLKDSVSKKLSFTPSFNLKPLSNFKDKVKTVTLNVSEQINKMSTNVSNTLKNSFKEKTTAIQDNLNQVSQTVKSKFTFEKNPLDTLKTKSKDIAVNMKENFARTSTNIKDSFSTSFNNIKDNITKKTSSIKEAVNKNLNFVSKVDTQSITSFEKQSQKVSRSVSTNFSAIPNNLDSGFKKQGKGILKTLGSVSKRSLRLFAPLSTIISSSLISQAPTIISSMSSVGDKLKSIASSVTNKFSTIGSSISTSVTNVLPTLKEKISKITTNITTKASNVFTNLKSSISSIREKTSSLVKSVFTKGKTGGAMGKVLGKGLAKSGFMSLLKKLPGVGLLTSAGFAVDKALKGDWAGAGLELASGAASTLPGLGTLASTGIDAAIMVRDAKKQQQLLNPTQDKTKEVMISNTDSNVFPTSFNRNMTNNPSFLPEYDLGLENNTSTINEDNGSNRSTENNVFSNTPKAQPISPVINNSISDTPVVSNTPQVNVNVPTNQAVSTAKMEQLLQQLIQMQGTQQINVNAVIGDQEARKLNYLIRQQNAQ